LRQAAAGIRRIGETGYGGVTSEFNASDAWVQGRERLAADKSLGDLYDTCRDAYGCIERIRLTALGWERPPSRVKAVDLGVRKIRLAADLRVAQVAIDKARTAVQEHLRELDQKPLDTDP
jgi:hypothetical protein